MKTTTFEMEFGNLQRHFNNTLLFIAGLGLLLLGHEAKSATYYSSANGMWNSVSTWRTLVGGTWTPATVIPGAADDVSIVGHTVQINTSQTCNNLYVGNGGIGHLEFINGPSGGRYYALTVKQVVSVNANCSIRYNNSAVNTYRLRIGRNLINGGTIQLASATNPAANKTDIEFFVDATYPNNSLVDKASGSMPVWSLGDVIINKTPTNYSVDVRDNGFENGIRTLIGNSGIYIHNNTGTYNLNAGIAYTIAPSMTFRIPTGTMNFSISTDILTLQGKLEVTGGTVNVGSAAGLEGIRSDQSGTTIPWLNVTSGTLNVNGGISNLATSGEPFIITISGGTVNLNNGSTGSARELLKVNNVTGSRFDMSAGTVVLRRPNTAAGNSVTDVSLCGANITNTITGGTIQFGSGTITKGFSFTPYYGGNTANTYPNMVVWSAAPAGSWTLAPATGNTSSFCFYSLTVNSTASFNMIPWGGTNASSTMYVTGVNSAAPSWSLALDGTYNTSVSTISFSGNMRQYAGSPSGAINTLYNLSVSNTNHVELRTSINLSNYLSMTLGNLITYFNYNFTPAQTTQHRLLTCLANCQTNAGSSSSYVDGPLVHTVVAPTTTTDVPKYWPIGKGGQFRPVGVNLRHNNTSSNTYMAEVINSAACVAPTLVPATLQGVSRVRYYQFWKTGGANFASGNIRIYYGADDGITDPATAMVGENNLNYNNCSMPISGGSATWIPYGNTVTNSAFGPVPTMPYVEKSLDNWRAFRSPNSLSNYQPSFALANPPGGANALPISLMRFDAKLANSKVTVTWTTQIEINNDFFTVERSRDNITYEPIGFVDGAGTTNAMLEYSFIDQEPPYGVSFYRLRQTDFDGQSEFYASVAISNRKGSLLLYPNPCTKPVVSVSIPNERMADYTFEVRDVVGREVPFRASQGPNGDVEIALDAALFTRGSFYIVYANDGSETLQQKLIAQ